MSSSQNYNFCVTIIGGMMKGLGGVENGEVEAKGRSGPRGTGNFYGPFVQFKDFFGDGQSKAGMLLSFSALIQLIKAIENMG